MRNGTVETDRSFIYAPKANIRIVSMFASFKVSGVVALGVGREGAKLAGEADGQKRLPDGGIPRLGDSVERFGFSGDWFLASAGSSGVARPGCLW